MPRYYQVYSSLQDRIRAGEFEPGAALPSERQLVKDYGVSRITIIKAMDLLEHDNLIEKQQGRGSFVTGCRQSDDGALGCRVAFCMPDFGDSYIVSVLIGAARMAMRQGVQLQIVGVESEEREASRIREAIESGANGLLVFPRSRYADSGLYGDLCERGFPLVLLDRYFPQYDTDWVTFDDEGAGYALTRHLISRGHRRIAIFPGHEVMVTSVHGRIQGYRRALEETGIPFDEDLICLDVYDTLSPATINANESSHLRLFDRIRRDAITAMVAINDFVALQMNLDLMKIRNEMMRAVIEGRSGLMVDEPGVEIAAISHRSLGTDQSSLVVLAIQSGETMGERAMDVLVRRMAAGDDLPHQRVVIPMEVVPVA
jgi:DNA-binding LacI/PurR family transcriptional regulator